MPAVPPPPADAAAWRLEVAQFRRDEPRRVFPLRLHVGHPAGARVRVDVPWPVPRSYDAGLCFDVADALLGRWLAERGPGPAEAWCWVARPGVPALHDADLAWRLAAVRACGASAVALAGVRVVTKTGWLDVATGERRTWKRLRLRGPRLRAAAGR